MSRCSLLEDLHLSCLGLKHIYVSKPHKLKIISIRELPHELQSVEIVVPSLQQFSFDRYRSILIDMVECPNLMALALVGRSLPVVPSSLLAVWAGCPSRRLNVPILATKSVRPRLFAVTVRGSVKIRVLERRESGKTLSDSVTERSDDSSVTIISNQ
ncbi:hypothetical protein QYF36_012386 [Acer negundo]|nr:hypothetical protein QYF36_012386 [Acer negundo]